MRIGLIVVTVWIGALKIFRYEAQGIVPFVANSPFFSWMLGDPDNYRKHKIPEGARNLASEAWHQANGTYTVALIIGGIIVTLGILIAAGWINPTLGFIGSSLLVGMSLVTLSFLITTPEVWVPNKGGDEHGFPLLAAPGRLVIKDLIMGGAAWVSAVDFAQRALNKQALKKANAVTA